MALIFYPAIIIYWELLLRALDEVNPFSGISLIPVVLFSLSTGFLLAFIFLALKSPRVSRILSGIILALLCFLFVFEYNCISFYKIYYGIIYATGMTGQVMGEFSSLAVEVALANLGKSLLFVLPLPLFIVFSKKLIPDKDKRFKKTPLILIPFAACFIAAVLFSRLGPNAAVYTYAFSVPASVPASGLLTTFRLEITYRLFGTPEEKLGSSDTTSSLWTPTTDTTTPDGSAKTPVSSNTAVSANSVSDNSVSANEAPEEPVVYGYNAAVDFASLIENESDASYKSMHEYFGSREPSMQNEYTGMFAGKNLILLTAEAFSPYAVDKDFTPTLYKLANESFVFTDYYQPGWSLSTTGGEFSNMTGIIPMWLDGNHSFIKSIGNDMPYAAGNLFGHAGYKCRAYHNSAYDYYDRDKTHPNLGYDYKGIGNGLQMELGGWPYSDLGMLEATTDEIIEDYLATGVPFHTYYMTVSGHCNYSWGANAMSAKHKDEAREAFPDEDPMIQAYKACNKELDLALEYLLKRLDETGILEDTVICMGADHYPYAMVTAEHDYYADMSGKEDTAASISRYSNTLILYCASMKEPVIVDTPCSSIDIMPTLANLFGLEYDSRLYSGRDIFATNYDPGIASETMPLVILPVSGGYSFVTPAGQYDAHAKTFTPNEGIDIEEDYVEKTKAILSNRWKYARLIISKDYYSHCIN